MTYTEDLRRFVKRWEGGPFLSPHWDAIGKVWDIGHGHVIQDDEDRRDITHDEVELLLDWDLHFFDDGVSALVSAPVAQCQYDALIALAYNIGLGAFGRSTLLGCVNDGHFDAAADEFMVWTRAQGKVITGLVRRRAAERAIFVDADYGGKP